MRAMMMLTTLFNVPGTLLPAVAAQGNAGGGTRVFVLAMLMVVALMLLAVAVVAVRKKMLGGSRSGAENAAGLMDGLRALRDSGRITEAEYQETKARLAGKVKAQVSARAVGSGGGPRAAGGRVSGRVNGQVSAAGKVPDNAGRGASGMQGRQERSGEG
jgi:hypothetical protein